MKRYIVTHEQLEALDRAGFSAGMIGSLQHYKQTLNDRVNIAIECRRIEVPDWATHFYGPAIEESGGMPMVHMEEIPK